MAALLDLVRRLIDYGKELAATLQQRAAENSFLARRAFGTSDLTVILASISRGLQRAHALEARLVRLAARPNKTAPSKTPPRKQRAARPVASQSKDARLAQLPTTEQIAAEVRRRPIGAVIADICRDLGILPNHPLWRELQNAIRHNGGSYVRLLKDILTRPGPLLPEDIEMPGPPVLASSLSPTCTGPP